jgi:transposase
MARKRRTFTKEFKEEVVKLVLEGGKSVSQAAKDLELTPSVVAGWVKQAKIDRGVNPSGALTTDEKRELAQLRKENRELRMEREILKKATAFFAKHST